MLSKERRIKEKDFPKNAKTIFRGDLLDVKEGIGASNKTTVAVVVGKNVSTKATIRNALRRLIYDALGVSGPGGKSYVVVVKKPVDKVTEEIKDRIKAELGRANKDK